jgi:ankyrin repeat protein
MTHVADAGEEEELCLLIARDDSRGIESFLRERSFDLERPLQRYQALGATPLMVAAYNGKTRVVAAPLVYGARTKTKDHNGKSALAYSAGRRGFSCMHVLLLAGANPNAVDSRGYSACHEACKLGDDEAEMVLPISMSVGRGASVTTSSPYNLTADIDVGDAAVRLLANAGADLDLKANDGSTPLHVAVSTDNAAAVDLLRRCGVRIDARDNSGRTPLCIAASRGNSTVCDNLFGAGARLDKVLSLLIWERNRSTPIPFLTRTLYSLMKLPPANGVVRWAPPSVESRTPEGLRRLLDIRLGALRAVAWKRRRHLCLDRALWRKPAAASVDPGKANAAGARTTPRRERASRILVGSALMRASENVFVSGSLLSLE